MAQEHDTTVVDNNKVYPLNNAKIEDDLLDDDYLDPSAYGFYDDVTKEDYPPWSWSLNNADGLSDWKILVSSINDDDKEKENKVTTYYVHKAILGTGCNRSEYFVKLFHQSQNNTMTELATSSTTLKLEKSACEAFPVLLDFFYSHDGQTQITIDNVVALRHFANYFGIRKLFDQTSLFIKETLNDNVSKALPLYLSEATCYHDELLANATLKKCISSMDVIEPSHFTVLPPDLATKIFEAEDVFGESEHLSIIVAVYCEAHKDEMDKDMFFTMTSNRFMHVVSPNAAISLLKTLSDLHTNASAEILDDEYGYLYTSLKEKFRQALSQSWEDIIVSSVVSKDKSSSSSSSSSISTERQSIEGIKITSHRALPFGRQIEILEASILEANRNLKQTKTKMKDLEVLLSRTRAELGKFVGYIGGVPILE